MLHQAHSELGWPVNSKAKNYGKNIQSKIEHAKTCNFTQHLKVAVQLSLQTKSSSIAGCIYLYMHLINYVAHIEQTTGEIHN